MTQLFIHNFSNLVMKPGSSKNTIMPDG